MKAREFSSRELGPSEIFVVCALSDRIELKLKVITDFFLFFFAEKEEEWFWYAKIEEKIEA